MTMKRLVHPNHGVHIIYSSAEYDVCIKNGWKDEPKQEPAPPPVAPVKEQKAFTQAQRNHLKGK